MRDVPIIAIIFPPPPMQNTLILRGMIANAIIALKLVVRSEGHLVSRQINILQESVRDMWGMLDVPGMQGERAKRVMCK